MFFAEDCRYCLPGIPRAKILPLLGTPSCVCIFRSYTVTFMIDRRPWTNGFGANIPGYRPRTFSKFPGKNLTRRSATPDSL